MSAQAVQIKGPSEDRKTIAAPYGLIPYVLAFLAFALRLYRIQTQSLWWDEGISAHLASLDISGILARRAGSQHPPLYYLALHYWALLTGRSEFSLRFFSLLFGTLVVPVVYVVAREIFDDATAAISALLVTCSPLYVVYSQEARVYILMPLVYSLLIWQAYRLVQGRVNWRDWLILALVEGLALYLHYFSIFAILWINLYLLFARCRKPNRSAFLIHWLLSQIIAVALFLPWLIVVAQHWGEATGRLGFRSLTGQTTGFLDYVRLIWHFFNGGKIEIIGDHRGFTLTSLIFAPLFLLALFLVLRRDERRHQTFTILAHYVMPLIISYVAWWWRPGSHPRYVIMFALPFLILLGRIIRVLWRGGGVLRAASLSVIGVVCLVMGFGLQIAYFDPGYYKDNVRALVMDLSRATTERDAIIVDLNDYSIEYYYTGPAPIYMIHSGDEATALKQIGSLLLGRERVFLVHAYKAIRGLRGLVPFALELNGDLTYNRDYQGYNLRRFDNVADEPQLPRLAPLNLDFGALRLTGVYTQPEAPAGNAVCVALRWQLVGDTEARYACALRLIDAQGQEVAWSDPILLNDKAQTTDLWQSGEEAVTYGIIPIPVGTPPLTYTVRLRVYDQKSMQALDLLGTSGTPRGQYYDLGHVRLTPAKDFSRDPYHTLPTLHLQPVQDGAVAEGLSLEGYRVDGPTAAPGQRFGILLQWRGTEERLPDYAPRLLLRQGKVILAEDATSPVGGLYPTSRWQAGEIVLERRVLQIPPDAEEGPASLLVALGSSTIPLTAIEIQKVPHSYAVPPMQYRVGVVFGGFAELLGYDLECTKYKPTQPIRITLYWRVVGETPPTRAYTVFTHLLNTEGRLVGQHDGVPAEGHRPTTGWLPGEVIADPHNMIIKDPAHRGSTRIAVGLYDSATIERVCLTAGGDHLILPTEIFIEGP